MINQREVTKQKIQKRHNYKRNIIVKRVAGIWKKGNCMCNFDLRSNALNIHKNIYGLCITINCILFRLFLPVGI